MPVSETNSQQIGLGILQRVAVRGKARLHKEFLTRLYQSPDSDRITLCGSMALHGVYLHQRWSKDLDFDAPKEVALRFEQIAAQAGLTVERREGWKEKARLQDALPYAFSQPSPFYPQITIGIEIFSRARILVAPERHEFVTASGERIQVFVKPLAEMLAVKLGCMVRRGKALDFADFWFGLSSDPCLRVPIRDLLQSGLCDAGDYTPPSDINADFLLQRLSRLEDTWTEDLSVYLTHVPDFAQVQEDLGCWLPFFSTHTYQKGGTV